MTAGFQDLIASSPARVSDPKLRRWVKMSAMSRDWVQWHAAYDDPGSPLSRRLAIVQDHVAAALDRCPPGSVTMISACAGQGRDVIGALAGHRRAGDVRARLVEFDERNAAVARRMAADAGLTGVEVLTGDAGRTDAYSGYVPADVVLVCGVFGNISDGDIRSTVAHLPGLCAEGATVLWTRHRKEPDLTPDIRRWFARAGFEELAFVTPEESAWIAVGVNRLVAPPKSFEPGVRLFEFAD
jgi:hypothetical protein